MGMTAPSGYDITEVFDETKMGSFKPAENFATYVNPTGVFFGKATVR